MKVFSLNIDKTNRLPSLDGLRAISIILVVVSHLKIGRINHYIDLGNLGVRMFFIISAFLIIKILFNQHQNDKFSVKKFYFNRVMRILPAFVVYLLTVFIILVQLNLFDFSQFWRAILFIENYHSRSNWTLTQWPVGHTWSLAVEEQFYLLIAIFFAVNSKNKIKKIGKTSMLLVCFLVPIIRVLILHFNFFPNFIEGSIHRSFETVADSLAFGGLLVFAINDIKNIRINPLFLLLLIFIIQTLNSSFATSHFGYLPRYLYNIIGISLQNMLLMLLVLNLTITIPQRHSNFSLYKILNKRLLVFIGILSYSIYLWQQLWTWKYWDFPLIYRIAGILICAILSYSFIERPFLNLRNYILKNWL